MQKKVYRNIQTDELFLKRNLLEYNVINTAITEGELVYG